MKIWHDIWFVCVYVDSQKMYECPSVVTLCTSCMYVYHTQNYFQQYFNIVISFFLTQYTFIHFYCVPFFISSSPFCLINFMVMLYINEMYVCMGLSIYIWNAIIYLCMYICMFKKFLYIWSVFTFWVLSFIKIKQKKQLRPLQGGGASG